MFETLNYLNQNCQYFFQRSEKLLQLRVCYWYFRLEKHKDYSFGKTSTSTNQIEKKNLSKPTSRRAVHFPSPGVYLKAPYVPLHHYNTTLSKTHDTLPVPARYTSHYPWH